MFPQHLKTNRTLTLIFARFHIWAVLLLLWGSITESHQPNFMPTVSRKSVKSQTQHNFLFCFARCFFVGWSSSLGQTFAPKWQKPCAGTPPRCRTRRHPREQALPSPSSQRPAQHQKAARREMDESSLLPVEVEILSTFCWVEEKKSQNLKKNSQACSWRERMGERDDHCSLTEVASHKTIPCLAVPPASFLLLLKPWGGSALASQVIFPSTVVWLRNGTFFSLSKILWRCSWLIKLCFF